MAKRTSSTTEPEVSRKQPCREDLLQSSLFKFYKPRDDSAEKLRPSTVPLTPASFNINIYSQSDIEKACGLNQQRLRFWNDKAAEICADRSAVRELGNSREAIEGAIHSSWTLHKTSILELQLEELEEKAKAKYDDEVAREHVLMTAKKNLVRLQASHATVTTLSDMIAESSGFQKVQLENQLSQEMSELKKAQDALSKAIQRSPVTETKDAVMKVNSPAKLSDEEFGALITEVKNNHPGEMENQV